MTNHLWQSTVFAVAAGLLTVVFRKNRAQVRYWLWLSASLKFLIPFSLLMSLGSHLQWTPAARTIATPIVSMTIVSSTMVQFTQPFPETVSFVPSTAGTPDWIPLTILGIWVGGFAAIALVRLRGWLRVRDAVQASFPLELPVPVDVRSSPGLLEPGVVGFWRPVLLLPEGIADCLTPRQLEAVLAHELCHIRHRDNLTSAVHMIVEAIFWFHPLVWWIGARLVDERERACDEAVLSLGSEPQVYAEGILNVCKIYLESPLRCVSGVTGSDLKKRIQAILTGRVAGELNFAKRVALAVAGVAALALPVVVGIMNAPAVRAQSVRAATPKWEVVAIRPCEDGPNVRGGGGEPGSPGRLNLHCVPVKVLIHMAYVTFASGRADLRGYDPQDQRFVPELPIEGGPTWINSARYEINAKAESGASYQMTRGLMMQTLLEDRFKLKIHRETREIPVYALTVAKGGPKLRPHAEGSCTVYDPNNPPPPPPDGSTTDCGMGWLRVKGPNLTFDPRAVTMAGFAQQLHLDRPVIDRTGIKGTFDIHLESALDDTTRGTLPRADEPGAVLPDPTGGTSIFTAVQQQLGLRLESTKGPGEFLVIDHVERPTEN